MDSLEGCSKRDTFDLGQRTRRPGRSPPPLHERSALLPSSSKKYDNATTVSKAARHGKCNMMLDAHGTERRKED